MAITDPYILQADVRLVPVAELPDRLRTRLPEGATDGVAVLRPRSRQPVKLVDAESAALLARFRTASPIVAAVIAHATDRGLVATELLDAAIPLLDNFIAAGVLVESGSEQALALGASLRASDRAGRWTIVACVQAFADVEVYQVNDDAGVVGALKLARADVDERVRAMLEREREALALLDGIVAPALLDEGEYEARRYLVAEWCPGARVTRVAAELRSLRPDEWRAGIVRLAADVASAFASLHERDVMHGDVHPGNVLVDARGGVRIIDYGHAWLEHDRVSAKRGRAGVPFYHEPELARALRGRGRVPRSSPRGEVYALAALLFELATGASYLDFSLDRAEALRQIEHDRLRTFAECGADPFDALEAVLLRALAKEPSDRHDTMRAFANALGELTTASSSATVRVRAVQGLVVANDAFDGGALADALLDEIRVLEVSERLPWRVPLAPWAHAGAAGVGYALLRLATLRDDARLLALADLWVARAESAMRGAPATAWWGDAGVHVVRALVANASGDASHARRAVQDFSRAAAAHAQRLDATNGLASTVLQCATLHDALLDHTARDAVMTVGDGACDELEAALRSAPPMLAPVLELNLGAAHGWAGALYASLRWRASRGNVPAEMTAWLGELAGAGEPAGRGTRWAWRAPEDGVARAQRHMGGWCNGSAGFVPLWSTAADVMRDTSYRAIAVAAAWHVWEDVESRVPTLCCGLAGRSYALASMYRASRDDAWLDRARTLALRAHVVVRERARLRTSSAVSLYKGVLGPALLLAELERPTFARMPLYESEGWS